MRVIVLSLKNERKIQNFKGYETSFNNHAQDAHLFL